MATPRKVGIDGTQALVVDHEQGVYVVGHALHAVEGLVYFLVAFEAEGYGDDAHGEDAHFLGHLGNDGCCAGAGAAAHASGDEGHAGAVVEHALDVFGALLGSGACLGGTVACGMPSRYMWFTALPPPPPTPMTLMMLCFSSGMPKSRISLLLSAIFVCLFCGVMLFVWVCGTVIRLQ